MYSTAERRDLIQYLDKTRDDLLSAIAGLSEAQLNFQPSPERWSIAGNVEHVALVEDAVGSRILRELDSAPRVPADSTVTDIGVLRKAVDRARKLDSSREFQPAGKPTAISVEQFLASRKKIVAFVQSTILDLRHIWTASRLFGPVDGHQRLLALAAHSARHTDQILEIKSNPNFPAC